MAYLSVPKIFRHLTFLHLSSPFIVDNCSHISNLSFAITYFYKIDKQLSSGLRTITTKVTIHIYQISSNQTGIRNQKQILA